MKNVSSSTLFAAVFEKLQERFHNTFLSRERIKRGSLPERIIYLIVSLLGDFVFMEVVAVRKQYKGTKLSRYFAEALWAIAKAHGYKVHWISCKGCVSEHCFKGYMADSMNAAGDQLMSKYFKLKKLFSIDLPSFEYNGQLPFKNLIAAQKISFYFSYFTELKFQ
jgi:hypothetical protein